MKNLSSLLLISLLSCSTPHNKHEGLRTQIADISKTANGTVGVSILHLEGGDTLTQNGTYHCVMQSTFKFPIAVTVLNQVDKGTLKLDDKIHLTKDDVADTLTWSQIRLDCPKGDTDVTIGRLVQYMVSQSDNIACDILLAKLGGPTVVEDYMHSIGINGISIKKTEKEMHSGWDIQYANWCQPIEMTHLLELFFKGKVLSPSSTQFLMNAFRATTTSPKRLRGLLHGVDIGHKSGSSGTNTSGLSAATNDLGFITLPDSTHLLISVFVTDAKASDTTRDAVIARIAKATYEEFSKK